MSEAGLVAQVNTTWRVIRVHDQNAWKRPAWSLQQRADDGAWTGRAAVRASGMLRDIVKAWCGPVDPAAARILAALPARVDLPSKPLLTIAP